MGAYALLLFSLVSFGLAMSALKDANEDLYGVMPLAFYVAFATFYIVLGVLALKVAWSVL